MRSPLGILREVARPALAALAALFVAGVLLAALGIPPGAAFAALLRGSFGSAAALTATALKATPLLLAGLAVALSFRCGVWNIGAEGQLIVGALCAAAAALGPLAGVPAPWAVLGAAFAGAAGGAIFAAIAGGLRAWRGVSEVVTTILLNFVAIQLVALAVHGPLQEAAGAYPKSDPLPAAAMLPALGRLHAGIPVALAMVAGVAVLLFRTSLGFRLRAVGLSPRAARFAGISPELHAVAAITIAGALAGLAGAFEVCGVTGQLYEGISPGHGYTAIAVALLARLHPVAVLPSALFFGALEAGAGAMQREAGVPSVVTEIVQGLVILLSLGFAFARTSRASDAGPAADELVEAG